MFLTRAIKKVFTLCGFEIRRIRKSSGEIMSEKIFTLRSEMTEAMQHLSDLGYNPDVIIDVGTANGTAPLLEVFPNAKFLFIEPLSEFAPDIQKLLSKYNGKYIAAAAGASRGKVVFNVHPDKVGSSLLNEVDGANADGISREIEMIMLDDLQSEIRDAKDILLKIDVQGAELEVLKGAKQLAQKCGVIVLEVSLFKFHVTGAEFNDVIIFMKNIGFVPYDIFGGHNRPLDFALAQKDILFVKEDGFFRKAHNWATEEQRRLLKENENN